MKVLSKMLVFILIISSLISCVEFCVVDASAVSGENILLIGDSISVHCQNDFKNTFPGITIDAKSGTRFSKDDSQFGKSGITRLKARSSSLPNTILFLMGTNGGVTEADIDSLISITGTDRKFILMTEYFKGNSSLTEARNAVITKAAGKYNNVYIADWYTAVKGDPSKYIADNVHPTQKGRSLFAKTVETAVNGSGTPTNSTSTQASSYDSQFDTMEYTETKEARVFDPDSYKAFSVYAKTAGWEEDKMLVRKWSDDDNVEYEREIGFQTKFLDDNLETTKQYLKEGDGSDLSASAAGKMVSTAKAEVGTTESPKGSGKVKYNEWFYGENSDFSNKPWDAVFIAWCADQNGLIESGLFKKTASVKEQYDYLVNEKKFETHEVKDIKMLDGTYDPVIGDIVFWKSNDNTFTHIGVISEVSEKSITVIEGDVDDAVKSKVYSKQILTAIIKENESRQKEESESVTSEDDSHAMVEETTEVELNSALNQLLNGVIVHVNYPSIGGANGGPMQMKSGAVVTSGAPIDIPSSVAQTGVIANFTYWTQPKKGSTWSPRTNQGVLFKEWKAQGSVVTNGIATINGYYLVAVTTKFGMPGDAINIVFENGTSINAIIGDSKSSNPALNGEPGNEYGHRVGRGGAVDVIEWEYGNPRTGNNAAAQQVLANGLRSMGIMGQKITRIINYGSWLKQ